MNHILIEGRNVEPDVVVKPVVQFPLLVVDIVPMMLAAQIVSVASLAAIFGNSYYFLISFKKNSLEVFSLCFLICLGL